jgi:type VI secretion system protein ImpA
VELDYLLEPISEDSPCGIDLEYDDEFRQLEEAARGKPGSVVDPDKPGASIAAVPPDWNEVRSLSESILRRSKDLRAVSYLLKSELVLKWRSAFGMGCFRRWMLMTITTRPCG